MCFYGAQGYVPFVWKMHHVPMNHYNALTNDLVWAYWTALNKAQSTRGTESMTKLKYCTNAIIASGNDVGKKGLKEYYSLNHGID